MKTILVTTLILTLATVLSVQVIKSAVVAKAGINSYSCSAYNLPATCLNK